MHVAGAKMFTMNKLYEQDDRFSKAYNFSDKYTKMQYHVTECSLVYFPN